MQSIIAVGTCGGGVIHPMVMTEHREKERVERGRESTLLSYLWQLVSVNASTWRPRQEGHTRVRDNLNYCGETLT